MRTAIFAGSFNPFTIGHDDIARRALALCDRLVIGVTANNVHKPDLKPAEERIATIKELYIQEPRIEVKAFSGLAADFAKMENAHFIVKGVRNTRDLEYEQEQAFVNRSLWGIETVLLIADPLYSTISSTMIRELEHFGTDTSLFIPRKKATE